MIFPTRQIRVDEFREKKGYTYDYPDSEIVVQEDGRRAQFTISKYTENQGWKFHFYLDDNEVIAKKIADKYIIEAEKNIQNKKTPPNIYKFNDKEFRHINGYDPEWYFVFNTWKRILESIGWKCYWNNIQLGESDFLNFQYYYKVSQDSLGIKPLDVDIKSLDWKRLKGSISNQCVI